MSMAVIPYEQSGADVVADARTGRRTVRVLFLTNNPNLSSTSRILQDWLTMGDEYGLKGSVVTQKGGEFSSWLDGRGIDCMVDPMPWLDKRNPVPAMIHVWRVMRFARRCGVDVIHCNEHNVYPFAMLLRRVLRRPVVCHVRYKLPVGFTKWAFGRSWRRPDALLWTSQQQKSDSYDAIEGVVDEGCQHVVPLGVNVDEFGGHGEMRRSVRNQWGVDDDAIVIGTASALRPRKRIEDFVELVRRLARRDERVTGVIAGEVMAGDEEYGRQIERQIDEAGIRGRVKMLGHVEMIESFMQGIDVFVSTSEYETFGNSVCEAMACRRVVAGYEGGSVKEVVGDTGVIVQTGDLDELIERVGGLIGDNDRRNELGELAWRRVARTYSPASSLRQLLTIYESLPRQR